MYSRSVSPCLGWGMTEGVTPAPCSSVSPIDHELRSCSDLGSRPAISQVLVEFASGSSRVELFILTKNTRSF